MRSLLLLLVIILMSTSTIISQDITFDICPTVPQTDWQIGDTINLDFILNSANPVQEVETFWIHFDLFSDELEIIDNVNSHLPEDFSAAQSDWYGTSIYFFRGLFDDIPLSGLETGDTLVSIPMVVRSEEISEIGLFYFPGFEVSYILDADEIPISFSICEEVVFDGEVVTAIDICDLPGSITPTQQGDTAVINIYATDFHNLSYFFQRFQFPSANYELVETELPGQNGLRVYIPNPAFPSTASIQNDPDDGPNGLYVDDGALLISLKFIARINDPGPIDIQFATINQTYRNYLQDDIEISFCDASYIDILPYNVYASVYASQDVACEIPEDSIAFPGWKLLLTDGTANTEYLLSSNYNGIVYGAVPTGTYNYTWIPPGFPDTWETCNDPSATIMIPEEDSVFIHDPINILTECHDNQVNISSSNLRPCFENSFFQISYSNFGTTTSPASFIDLTIDPAFTPLSSSLEYTDMGEGLYRFTLGDLEPGQTGNIILTGRIDCNYPVGNTICATAVIYPNKDCPIDIPAYEGGEIEVSSSCDGDSVRFTATNIGDGPTGIVTYTVIADNFTETSGELNLAAGSTSDFVFPANGATWRLEFERPTASPYLTHALSIVEGCNGDGGMSSIGWVTAFSLLDFDPYYDRYCLQTSAAYDPNDKTATPFGVGPDHFIFPNGTIDYRIRFQNTGTDTAFTVVVRDTIDTDLLDMNTFRAGISSHDYNLTIANGNELIFTFDDIQLVDSFTNEPGSNGFLHYQISQQPELEDFTEIDGRAGIYFDFNDVVLTEYSELTVARDFLVSSTKNYGVVGAPIKVFPNPANTQLRFSKANWPGEVELRIYDGLGREIQSGLLNNSGDSAKVAHLNSGVYFYRLSSSGRLLQTGNFTKQ